MLAAKASAYHKVSITCDHDATQKKHNFARPTSIQQLVEWGSWSWRPRSPSWARWPSSSVSRRGRRSSVSGCHSQRAQGAHAVLAAPAADERGHCAGLFCCVVGPGAWTQPPRLACSRRAGRVLDRVLCRLQPEAAALQHLALAHWGDAPSVGRVLFEKLAPAGNLGDVVRRAGPRGRPEPSGESFVAVVALRVHSPKSSASARRCGHCTRCPGSCCSSRGSAWRLCTCSRPARGSPNSRAPCPWSRRFVWSWGLLSALSTLDIAPKGALVALPVALFILTGRTSAKPKQRM